MGYSILIEYTGEKKWDIKIVNIKGTANSKAEILFVLKKAKQTIKKYKVKHVYLEENIN